MPNPIVTLIGNLVSDPELRFTPSGKAVANFRVLTSRSAKNAAGEWEDHDVTGWDCAVWEQQAENVAETLSKGDPVIVTGVAKQQSWEDKNSGEKRSKIVVDVYNVGLDLKRRTARVERPNRSGGGGGYASPNQGGVDPWATPAPAPAATGAADPWGPVNGQPPF